VNVGDKLNLLN